MSIATAGERFIGDWVLEVDRCHYEQGSPPRSGSYRIEREGEELVFHMKWVDVEGEIFNLSFRGIPDGEPRPYSGGELADHLSLDAPSPTKLNSSAYLKGVELMIATRTLVDGGKHMVLTQTIILPDGSKPTNSSRYRRKI
ncbi:hypothetical protein [Cohaesibacter gelatinilyticus]|uniref:Lipocalin-like domain-containing protein n=1 Tax=Cohaesibacter gelatinilyticus TaxID=372072 RepID=A0A285N6S8_9HYPH|nr:hypothetical protein [Cohaesibacter gelatinilyticus]SNZ05129.1 hypothetical protein SAMN06265368_0040 [Cohaesibacter gelatinilyticus]